MWNRLAFLLALGIAVGLSFPAAEVMGQKAGQMGSLMRMEGSITALDLKAQPSILKLTDEQGKLVTLSLDSRTTTVFREGRPAKLEALQVGQRVKVEAISKEGKQFAKTVEVLPASPAAPQSAAP